MARPGHGDRQARHRLPGRTPPRRDPHPGTAVARSAIDHPPCVRRPRARANDVLHELACLTDGDGVLIRILVALPVGEDEPVARPRSSGVHGMLAGITLAFEQHHHRSLGIRHEGQQTSRRTGQPRLKPPAVDPRPKSLHHPRRRYGDRAVVIDHPRLDHEHDDLTDGSERQSPAAPLPHPGRPTRADRPPGRPPKAPQLPGSAAGTAGSRGPPGHRLPVAAVPAPSCACDGGGRGRPVREPRMQAAVTTPQPRGVLPAAPRARPAGGLRGAADGPPGHRAGARSGRPVAASPDRSGVLPPVHTGGGALPAPPPAAASPTARRGSGRRGGGGPSARAAVPCRAGEVGGPVCAARRTRFPGAPVTRAFRTAQW